LVQWQLSRSRATAFAGMKASRMLLEAFGEDVMDHCIHTAEWELRRGSEQS
jgi:glutamine synthetase